MATDDRQRGIEGVIASVVKLNEESVRIVFDDVKINSSEWPYQWQTKSLYTWIDLDANALTELTISEKQLADIGACLIARLRAKSNA